MTQPSASILIVDDEEMVRGLLSELLESSYWCATAASAERTLALGMILDAIRSHTPAFRK